jgi:hypothetical protein
MLVGKIQRPCFSPVILLLALLTDVPGGRIRMTRSRLIVGLITPYRPHLTITRTRKGRPRPDPGCSATDDDDDDDDDRMIVILWSLWAV